MAHSVKIQLTTLLNTRDLGGLVGQGGRRVKSKALLRSGELLSASKEDLQTLYDNYNLRTIIDLRNKTEAEQKPDRYLPSMTYIDIPILTEAQMGMTHEKEMDAETSEYRFVSSLLGEDKGLTFMKDLYKNFVTKPNCLIMYKEFVLTVLNSKPGSILYHCSVGKDRVGVGTFILLSLLGVERNDIIEDFMLTNVFIEDDIVKHIANLSKKIDSSLLEKTYRDLFSVRKDYIQTVINDIETNYSSFDNFALKGLGLTQDQITKLQDKYLE